MTLSEFILWLKVHGEATISVEDAQKIIFDGEFPDAKKLFVNPPIDPKIYDYYGERNDNG